jgi:hypothetical protein
MQLEVPPFRGRLLPVADLHNEMILGGAEPSESASLGHDQDEREFLATAAETIAPI